MLSEHVADQAEGLRRLLVPASARAVTVVAAHTGMGATSVVVNLAAALAQAGKNALVLDGSLPHDSAANMLALKPRHDLLDAVRHDKPWHETTLHFRQGVRILSAMRAIRALPQLSAAERGRLLECLDKASRGADIVLVDAAACTGANLLSAGLAPGQTLLLVLNATASAITGSYAMLKRMSMLDGRQNFQIVVNKARDEQEAQTVFGNVAQVARRHLHVRVEYLGYIPFDEKLKRAAQLCRPVVEVFPHAPSALAFGALGEGLMLLPAAGNGRADSLPDMIQRLVRQVRPPNAAHAN